MSGRMRPAARRGADRRQTFLRGCTLACLLLALAACRDGYSTSDQQQKSPSEMTSVELLAEMNRIGAQQHVGREWRYRLQPDCQLEVTDGNHIGARDRTLVPLADAVIETRVDKADKTYGVRLRKGGAPADAAISVLEGGKWTDSVSMRSLLQNLQRRCGETEALKP